MTEFLCDADVPKLNNKTEQIFINLFIFCLLSNTTVILAPTFGYTREVFHLPERGLYA